MVISVLVCVQDTERSELKTVIDSIAKIRKRQASLAAVTSETLAQLCSQVCYVHCIRTR